MSQDTSISEKLGMVVTDTIPVTALLLEKLFPSPSALEIVYPDISNGCC